MPLQHVFLIPAIFFLGFFLGSIVAQSRLGQPISGPRLAQHKRTLLVALVVFIATLIATHALRQGGGAASLEAALHGASLLDKLPSFSGQEVHARLDGFGQAGRRAYQRFTYTSDVIFPLSFLLFIVAVSRLVLARTKASATQKVLLFAFPALWFSSDMIENAIIYDLLTRFPNEEGRLSGVLGFVTMAKFGLMAASIAVPAIVNALYTRSTEGSDLE